ncbi:hypothetical protein H1R20_g10186, partial [Candolleomyces eurysporus]
MPAVTLIDAIPAFATQEEYSSLSVSTPSSFNDLPPVLKYKEENVSVDIQPPVEGFSNEDSASGTLYVLTSVLAFTSSTGRSFQVKYPSITLHAVSRSGPRQSIYCQLDESEDAEPTTSNGAQDTTNGAASGGADGEGEGEEEEGEGNEGEFSEMRELNIIPASAESLDAIFEALSQCASLHPDKFSDDEDMEGDAFMDDGSSPFEVFTGDGDEELSEVGKAALAHLESIIYDPFQPKEDDDDAVKATDEDEPEQQKQSTEEVSTQKVQS